MNFDNIVREWSYRIKSGTPDITSQKDKSVLRDILREEKIAEPIISELIDNMSKVSLNEMAMQGFKTKIQEIVKFLMSEKVFAGETIDTILNLVKRDEEEYLDTIDKISSFGMQAKHTKEIVDKIFSYSEQEVKVIVEYLKNRSVGMGKLKGATSIKALFGSTGINGNFLDWINNYTYAATPAVGSGEVALAILCKGGNKAGGKGDVLIDGKEVEVKGSGGRIKGQKGYSMGTAASSVFAKALKGWIEKLHEKDRPIKLDKVPAMGSNGYQLGPSSFKKNALNNAAPALIKGKACKKDDIIAVYKEALTAVYHTMDVSWVKKHVDAKGQVNITKFNEDFFRACLKYYFKVEGFEHLIILDRKGNMKYIDSKTDPVGKIKIGGYPSFTSGAGSQGATFQIGV